MREGNDPRGIHMSERDVPENQLDADRNGAILSKFQEDSQTAHDEAVDFLVERDGISKEDAESHPQMEALFEEILGDKRPARSDMTEVNSQDINTKEKDMPMPKANIQRQPRARISPVPNQEYAEQYGQPTYAQSQRPYRQISGQDLDFLSNLLAQNGFTVNGSGIDNSQNTITLVLGV